MQCCLSWAADRAGPQEGTGEKWCVGLGYLDLGNCTTFQVSCITFGKSFLLFLFQFPTCKMEKQKSRPSLCQQDKTRTGTMRRGQKTPTLAVPSKQSLSWCIEMSCAERCKHHISSAQRSARVIFDKQLVTLAQHQTDVSNYAYNRRKEIFISSQILCVLYYWW